MTTTILSPHLDDAVLSCWHVLESRGDVAVVTVFTGSPPPGTPAPAWDRLTGADDPVTRMAERRGEDRDALALAGRRGEGLGLLDAQYRPVEPEVGDVVAAVRAALRPGTVIHAPAGLGGHPDHVLVRDSALELARGGWPLALYADLPHGIRYGWPAWVSGVAEPGGQDVGAEWTGVLAAAGLNVERLVPYVRPLDAAARARKLRALDAYVTQRAPLDDMTFVPLEDPRALGYEVGWRVPRSALGGADERRGERRVTDARCQPVHDRR